MTKCPFGVIVLTLGLAVTPAMAVRAQPAEFAIIAVNGTYRLTATDVSSDADYVEINLGRKLTEAEVERLQLITVGQFRRDPKWTLDALNNQITAINAVLGQSPDDFARMRAAYRESVATAEPSKHFTADELAILREVVGVAYQPAAPAVDHSAIDATIRQAIDAYGVVHGGTAIIGQLQALSMHP